MKRISKKESKERRNEGWNRKREELTYKRQ